MPWTYEVDPRADKSMQRLGPSAEAKIRAWLEKRIHGATNPRLFGKPLRRGMKGLWRYRVEDYRLLCRLEDHRLIVLVIEAGHRSTVYED